jgi:hypothetical protein
MQRGGRLKNCPFCAEQIQDEAVKCRHCGEALDTPAAKWRIYRKKFEAMPPDERAREWARLTPSQQQLLTKGGPATIPAATTPAAVATRTKSKLTPLWIGIGIGSGVAALFGLGLLGQLLTIETERRGQPQAAQSTPQRGNAAKQGEINPALAEQLRLQKARDTYGVLGTAAHEFEKRLTRNYDGTLEMMRLNGDTVSVGWTSGKCDYFDGEVVDLVLSINRSERVSFTDLQGHRTCEGQSKDFSLSAGVIEEYRRQRINDTELIEKLRPGKH